MSRSRSAAARVTEAAPVFAALGETTRLALVARLCTEGPLVTDPLLGALAENGGPTETLVPLASSPARGHARDCPPFDQRGQPRNSLCTSGAVEAP